MAEELQGPSGPHGLKADLNPIEQAERQTQEPEDIGILGGQGTAPALENEEVE